MKTILFQGDSITDCGRKYEDANNLGKGFAAICARQFMHDKTLRFYNRGVSGDRASHLRSRWQADCLDLKPDILVLAEGVNEVLVKFFEGDVIPLADFERDYLWCIEAAFNQNKNLKLVIVEPFVQLSPLPPSAAWQNEQIKQLLPPYIDIVKRAASKYADIYIPLNDIYLQCNEDGILPQDIAEDGIHPSPLGHYIYSVHMVAALKKLL